MLVWLDLIQAGQQLSPPSGVFVLPAGGAPFWHQAERASTSHPLEAPSSLPPHRPLALAPLIPSTSPQAARHIFYPSLALWVSMVDAVACTGHGTVGPTHWEHQGPAGAPVCWEQGTGMVGFLLVLRIWGRLCFHSNFFLSVWAGTCWL